MKAIFLLPVISEARCHKRIRELKKLGVQPKIFAFERDYYEGKTIEGWYELLGNIQHGKYYKRFIPFSKALFKIRSAINNVEMIYAFGLDMLLLGWLASRGYGKPVKLVYEVADIREILTGERLESRLCRKLERFLLQYVDMLVVTSEAYITGYYRQIQGMDDLCYKVIENKLDVNDMPLVRSPAAKLSEGSMRIGYFGVIRCQRSWEILKEVAKRGNGKVTVYVRGIPRGLDSFEEEARSIPYIEYGGPYVSPDDLDSIYQQVNIVWACYTYQGTGTGNWRWARTNRFYESCFFKKPMFAQAGSEDGRLVDRLGIGACLNLDDIGKTADRILTASHKELVQWQENIEHLPTDIYLYKNEHRQLLQTLT